MTTIIDGTSGITFPEGNNQKGALTLATAKTTTSGTFVDFTGIPSWAKRITVMFNGVSTNGTSTFQIQVGTSAGVETTGYVSSVSSITTSVSTASVTTGFAITNSAAAANTYNGSIVISALSSNIWTELGSIARNDAVLFPSAGTKTLSGTLDRIRITTVNGTDLFDAGSVNIMYE
jgi:hypothetical protein